jgi:hypothetical protein
MDDGPSGWCGFNLDFMKDSEKHPLRSIIFKPAFRTSSNGSLFQ